MLTIIGYSINDTIVIFDRVRENARGKNIKDTAALAEISLRLDIVFFYPVIVHKDFI